MKISEYTPPPLWSLVFKDFSRKSSIFKSCSSLCEPCRVQTRSNTDKILTKYMVVVGGGGGGGGGWHKEGGNVVHGKE